jgi:hypothetical protein
LHARSCRGFGLKTLLHGFGANVVLFGRYAHRPYIAFIGTFMQADDTIVGHKADFTCHDSLDLRIWNQRLVIGGKPCKD